MAQYDREYFKKQFEGLPPNATAMIALRAAMRVFPVLARRSKAADPAFRFWTVAHSGRHTLAVCRSFQSLAFSLTNGSPAVSGRAFVNADAMLTDIAQIQQIQRPSRIDRPLRRADAEADPVFLLAQPLWRKDMPAEAARLWTQLQRDLRGLDAGFEVWIDWYQDRLDGKPFDREIERQWALLSKEQLAQSPAEINAYLKALRDGALTKELKRVRAIFIGHGEGQNIAHPCAAWRGCDRRQGADDAGNRHQGCGVVHAQNGAGSGRLHQRHRLQG